MTGLQVYLLIAPLVLFTLAGICSVWWVRHAPKDPDATPPKGGKAS